MSKSPTYVIFAPSQYCKVEGFALKRLFNTDVVNIKSYSALGEVQYTDSDKLGVEEVQRNCRKYGQKERDIGRITTAPTDIIRLL